MKLIALLTAATALTGAAASAALAEQSFIDGPGGIRIVVVDKVLHNIVDTEDTTQAYSASYRPAANFPIPSIRSWAAAQVRAATTVCRSASCS